MYRLPVQISFKILFLFQVKLTPVWAINFELLYGVYVHWKKLDFNSLEEAGPNLSSGRPARPAIYRR